MLAPPLALPLTGFVVIFVVLSLSADARELYALPLLLPLALLATPATDTLRRGAANLIYWFSVMGGGFFVIVAWFYWSALELAMPPNLHDHLHDSAAGLRDRDSNGCRSRSACSTPWAGSCCCCG